MTAPDAQPPAATGAVDGLADWMRSVSWTSGPEANRIPEDLIDDVAALLHRKITAVAAALLARPGVSAALAGTTTPTDEPLRTTAVAPLEHLLRTVLLESAGESAAVVAEKLTHAVLNAEWRPVSALSAAPSANWSSAWAELTGYVGQAVEDGTQIDAAGLDVYLAELKRRALSPVRDWMSALLASTPTTEDPS